MDKTVILLIFFMLTSVLVLSQADDLGVDPGGNIEYSTVRIKLSHGKYLTLKDLAQGLLDHFDIEMHDALSLPPGKVEISGIKGFVVITTISLMFGDFADVFREGDEIVMRYKREDVVILKDKVRNYLAKMMIRVFSDSIEPTNRKRYGVYPIREEKEGKPYLLMVHGIDSDAACFNDLVKVLGHDFNCYFFEYPNDQGIAESAVFLAKEMVSIPSEKIYICAKSMGCLIVREYLSNPDLYKHNVDRFIMIAPPNHGSNLGNLRSVLEFSEGFTMIVKEKMTARNTVVTLIKDGLGKAGDDISRGSLFLNRLNQRKLPEEITYAIIAGDSGLMSQEQHTRLVEWVQAKKEAIDAPVIIMVFSKIVAEIQEAVEVINGKGDIVVSLESAKLQGAVFFKVVHENHISILKGNRSSPVFKEIIAFFEGDKLKGKWKNNKADTEVNPVRELRPFIKDMTPD